ncbi:STAS domain-containing protein [Paractinoplanes atraurantiacus]|uniref:Anti-sigma factor antagonist n=1 Tax=Paractinoplanes atraurantiacus TaxID=1036182 RepID=A0A285IGG9_9ACTN|nr:STAS domain-containing protein [Actinoplanes atraurantiacus]SNY47042.1 anti-anti-sigma factor [Actinoplanes atraurantiacus]
MSFLHEYEGRYPQDDLAPLVMAVRDVDAVVALAGEIDMDNAAQVRQFLDGVLQREQPRNLVIDMGEVTFLGSAGIHALLHCHTNADRLGSRLEIQHIRPQIQQVLEICGVTDMFHVSV